jgi:hypothetical protein
VTVIITTATTTMTTKGGGGGGGSSSNTNTNNNNNHLFHANFLSYMRLTTVNGKEIIMLYCPGHCDVSTAEFLILFCGAGFLAALK